MLKVLVAEQMWNFLSSILALTSVSSVKPSVLVAHIIQSRFSFLPKPQSMQASQMAAKDSRIKLMNEILNGIKVLKLYAWETSFQQTVMEIRKKELKIALKASYLAAFMTFIWTSAPFFVSIYNKLGLKKYKKMTGFESAGFIQTTFYSFLCGLEFILIIITMRSSTILSLLLFLSFFVRFY